MKVYPKQHKINMDFEQELYNHFGQVKDFTLGMQIGKYFYELGCRRTAEKYDEIEYKRQRADVCDGEEEEYEQIKQKVCSDCPSHKDDDCGYVTRQLQRKCNYLSDVMYGYELGRQSKPTTTEGLEEELDKWRHEHFHGKRDNYYAGEYLERTSQLDLARHFAQWQKEQMMKEAVEGKVRNIILHENGDEVHYSITYPKGKSQYSINDKVKIIIL